MKFIAYHRIFDSHGLALDSQRESVSGFVAQEGGELVGEYSESVTDVAEVGEQFEAAIQHCSRIKAVLVLAESDPLSRQLRMLARLVGQHVPLAAAGLSNVNAVLQPLFTETAFGTGHDHLVARQPHGFIQRLITTRFALQARQQHAAKRMQAFQVGIVVGAQLRQEIVGTDKRRHVAPKQVLNLLGLRREPFVRLLQG